MSDGKHHVFVYGTLKDGFSNNRLLKDAEFISRGCTILPYRMYETGGFPVVFQEHQDGNVSGECYAVTDEQLKRLDSLEGHPNFFERREIAVDLGDTGIQQTCWMYFGNTDWWSYTPDLPVVKKQADGAFNWRSE